MKKKYVHCVLIIAIICSGFAFANAVAEESGTAIEMRSFTDSLGREIMIPEKLDKVAVSGPLAQMVLFAICPDNLVGVATEWEPSAEEYLDSKYYDLPLIGQLYGGKGQLNLETLLSSGAQVVIDVGEPKKSAKDDLDALQKQTGIPFVHITGTLTTMGDAYLMLGELLQMQRKAEELSQYCNDTCSMIGKIASEVEKTRILYITGPKGLNVIARGSYHAEVIDMLSDNIALLDNPSSKGTGNEVDMEQILKWNPDVVIFSPDSIFDTVADDVLWSNVNAIMNDRYYEIPFGPYNWIGFPPSVQRYLGMMWMARLLYPDNAGFDLYHEVERYFNLFYHCDVSRVQFDELVSNSIGRCGGVNE
jgi:iron complex transport system substrate-binding protein